MADRYLNLLENIFDLAEVIAVSSVNNEGNCYIFKVYFRGGGELPIRVAERSTGVRLRQECVIALENYRRVSVPPPPR